MQSNKGNIAGESKVLVNQFLVDMAMKNFAKEKRLRNKQDARISAADRSGAELKKWRSKLTRPVPEERNSVTKAGTVKEKCDMTAKKVRKKTVVKSHGKQWNKGDFRRTQWGVLFMLEEKRKERALFPWSSYLWRVDTNW